MKTKLKLIILVVSLLFNALTCVSLVAAELYLDFFAVEKQESFIQKIEYPVIHLPSEKSRTGYPIIILPTPAANEIQELNGELVW